MFGLCRARDRRDLGCAQGGNRRLRGNWTRNGTSGGTHGGYYEVALQWLRLLRRSSLISAGAKAFYMHFTYFCTSILDKGRTKGCSVKIISYHLYVCLRVFWFPDCDEWRWSSMVKYGQGNTMILPLEAHDVSRVRGQFWFMLHTSLAWGEVQAGCW